MKIKCTSCQNYIKENSDYCVYCGKENLNKPSNQTEKKPYSRFILNPPQRKIFVKKILPLLFIGACIWFVGEIFFTYSFGEIGFSEQELIIYLLFLFLEGLLFLAIYLFAKYNKPMATLSIYFVFSFLAGNLSIPIVNLTSYIDQVHMFVGLSASSSLIVLIMGGILKENFFARGKFFSHFLIFLLELVIVEIIFVFAFSIQNYLLTIPIITIYIIAVSLIVMFYGTHTMNEYEDEPWIFRFVKILRILLISIIIAIIVVVLLLIVIICFILSEGEADFDLSGIDFDYIRSGKRKKKKN